MRREVTDAVANALRFPHTAVVKVEVWRGGTRLDTGLSGGSLPILAGQVKDDATAKVRRSLTLEVPATDEIWNMLAVPGTELRPYRGIELPGGASGVVVEETSGRLGTDRLGSAPLGGVTESMPADGRFGVDPFGLSAFGGQAAVEGSTTTIVEASGGIVWVPLGRLEVDQPQIGYAASGNLSVTAADAYAKVQSSEFVQPGIADFGTLITTQIVTFLRQALPSVPVQLNLTNSWVIGSKVYEVDRAAAIEEMLAAIGAELLFDGDGTAVIRAVPTVAAQAVWTVDAGEAGVMLSADRQGLFKDTRNLVIVSSTAVDGEPSFAPVYVWDNNPASPTYAGPDPVNNPGAAGPFGVRPARLASSAITDAQQALQAGNARLAQITGRASQLTLGSAVHPGLEAGDTIAVRLPPDPVSGARLVEAHIVESVTIPLTVDGQQQITTRARGVAS